MKRTDRLFEIMQMFRGGRLLRASDMARRLEVCVRTIYRDIETLVASGIPIEGERGVGYILREPIFLPPLTLTEEELQALHLGMEIVRKSGGAPLREAARQLLVKIDAVLPQSRRNGSHLAGLSVYTPALGGELEFLRPLRRAVNSRSIAEIEYCSLDETVSVRCIRPLQTEFWGRVWTCTAWCELREGFRVFRIDRIRALTITQRRFTPERGKTYADYVRQLEAEDKK